MNKDALTRALEAARVRVEQPRGGVPVPVTPAQRPRLPAVRKAAEERPQRSRLPAIAKAAAPPAPVTTAERAVRPRMVIAAQSRAARRGGELLITPSLFAGLAAAPVDIALAVSDDSGVHTTSFGCDPCRLVGMVQAHPYGANRLFDILDWVLQAGGVQTIVYIANGFAEQRYVEIALNCPFANSQSRPGSWGDWVFRRTLEYRWNRQIARAARALRMSGSRLIVLFDTPSDRPGAETDSGDFGAGKFSNLANPTGGGVIRFDEFTLHRIRDVVEDAARPPGERVRQTRWRK